MKKFIIIITCLVGLSSCKDFMDIVPDNVATLEYAFRDDSSLLNQIREMGEVKEVSRRVHASGLVICGDTTAPAEITGIEPARERHISTLHNYILPGGRYLEEGDNDAVVIGHGLAKKLGAGRGDTISVVSQGFDGSIAADSFTVKGLFSSPETSFNSGLALISYSQANETFSMSGYVSSYVVRLHDTGTALYVRDSIRSFAGRELEVMAWDELMPEIIEFIILKRFGSYLFHFIMYMIVAFGILNTIQMAVYERTRELGIMLSIGTSPSKVFSIIITESVIIALIGIAAGLLAGAAFSWYFTVYPMDISAYRNEMELYNVTLVQYYSKLKPADFYNCAFIVLFLTVVFTIFPARRASKLDPVKAIRHL